MSDIVETLRFMSYPEAGMAVDEINRLRSYVEKLESRLEIDCVWRCGSDGEMVRVEIPKDERPDEPHDGIFCRDETIKLQDEAIERLRSLLKEAGEALDWYGEQTRLCRLIHSGGDAGRNALADDGGSIARTVLSKIKGEA